MRLFQHCLKFLNTTQRTLPFVVIGAVAWATAGLLFPANVNAKIVNPVVSFDAVHVIDTFGRSERAAKVLRHDKAMLKDWLPAFLHGAINGQQGRMDVLRQDQTVSGFCNNVVAFLFSDIKMRPVFKGGQRAWSAKTTKTANSNSLSDLRTGPSSFLFASRTSNNNDDARAIQIAAKPKGGNDGFMIRQWGEVSRSWHAFLRTESNNSISVHPFMLEREMEVSQNE